MKVFGKHHIHLKSTTSTNDVCKELIRNSVPNGLLITSSHQISGRGRFERTWSDEFGLNFLGSFILHPTIDPVQWNGLSLLSSLAVYETIYLITQIYPDLKWPNDVLIHKKKVAGILIETTLQSVKSSAIIGIGININQTNFENKMRIAPTSLKLESNRHYEIDHVTNVLCKQFDKWYDEWLIKSTEYIVYEWKKRSKMIAKFISLTDGSRMYEGIAEDINSDGSIRLRRKDGTLLNVYSGELNT